MLPVPELDIYSEGIRRFQILVLEILYTGSVHKVVRNNLFILKGVVSGHYTRISQFTYKCIVWTDMLSPGRYLQLDEEGRYVYRSEIRQALKIRFSQRASKERQKFAQIASILIHLE